jgi:hypothetical protein
MPVSNFEIKGNWLEKVITRRYWSILKFSQTVIFIKYVYSVKRSRLIF